VSSHDINCKSGQLAYRLHPDLPTPFNETGGIDLKAFERLCERQILADVSAFVVCETAGEASTLSADERDTIIRVAVEVARGRARVIAGAGSNSTSKVIELTRCAEAAGADYGAVGRALLQQADAGRPLRSHFRTIAASTGLPIILHDISSRSVRELANETLARLAEFEQFIGLRDGSGDVVRPMRLSSLLPPGFRLLCGDDATTLVYIASGGDGCISIGRRNRR
jgi:4-hydroxy-tetrahydrodipicolinate synthase